MLIRWEPQWGPTIWQTYLRCCCPRGLLIWTDEKILNTDYFMVKRWLHPFGMIHWDATQFRVQWPTRENCHGAQKCVTWLTEPSERQFHSQCLAGSKNNLTNLPPCAEYVKVSITQAMYYSWPWQVISVKNEHYFTSMILYLTWWGTQQVCRPLTFFT